MTVASSNITDGPFAGNDIADTFSYTFRIENKNQIVVFETDDLGVQTVLTVDVDYTVTGLGVDAGGTAIRTAGPLPTDFTWYIRANYLFNQLTSFSSQGAFFPEIHESAIDKLTYLMLQLSDSSDGRAFRLAGGIDIDGTFDLNENAATRASRFLGFDSSGNLISSAGTGTGGIAEAPVDGSPYSRQDAGWVASATGGVSEAPVDGTIYGRKDAGWVATATGVVEEAPQDASPYVRQDADWVAAATGGVSEAPSDGNPYSRQDAGWVLSKLPALINVKDFGATGDGTTDDATAIAAAVTAASAGDTVIFPAPSVAYKIGSEITVAKRIYLEGSGAEITTTAAIAMFNLTIEGASINGFKLTGDRTAGQKGVRIGQNFIKARNLNITLVDQGVEVYGGVWQRLEHIRSRNIVTTVLEVGNVIGTVVEDFRYDTDTGSFAEPTTGIDLYGEGCNFSDLDFIHAGTALSLRTNARDNCWNFFNSCSFDTSTYGVRIVNTDSGQIVKGIMFDHCWFSSHSEAGAYINGAFNTNGISFKGCYFVNNDKNGMIVDQVSTNVQVGGSTFAGNSVGTPNTFSHIKHDGTGDVSVLTTSFGNWGALTTIASAAIERIVGAGPIIIGNSSSNSSFNTLGFSDASASAVELSTNFGNLPSAPVGAGSLPDSTTETTGNLNITSSDATFNTIRGRATVQSGVEGTTSAAAAFGGVFSNTAGGSAVGLRVDAGDTEFAGDVQVDVNLAVTGTSTLAGAVAGSGFVTAVDARVTYEVLNAKSDVGTGATQVARGNHTHTSATITDLQKSRMFGVADTTDGSGQATFAHGFGQTPDVGVIGTFGGAANKVDVIAWDSTNMTVEVRDITNNGALKTSAALTFMVFIAEAP